MRPASTILIGPMSGCSPWMSAASSWTWPAVGPPTSIACSEAPAHAMSSSPSKIGATTWTQFWWQTDTYGSLQRNTSPGANPGLSP
jgi:hypothetical protein